MMWRYGHYYNPGMGWWGIVPAVGEIVFWIVLALIIASVIRSRRSHWENREPEAVEILKERYAKGEITKKEFEEMKKDLLA